MASYLATNPPRRGLRCCVCRLPSDIQAELADGWDNHDVRGRTLFAYLRSMGIVNVSGPMIEYHFRGGHHRS